MKSRAGTADARTPLNAILGQLDALGKPRFRLSCREADWLGTNDQKHLDSVAPDGAVTVLRLNPLTDADIVTILDAQLGTDDAQEFIENARERGVDRLLKNPQSLELLVRAVASGGWPESRLDTFERACSHIAKEPNEEHLIGAPPPALGDLLDAAGRLCAVQLIAGIAGYTVGLGRAPTQRIRLQRNAAAISNAADIKRPLPLCYSRPSPTTPVWFPFTVTLRNFLVPDTSPNSLMAVFPSNESLPL